MATLVSVQEDYIETVIAAKNRWSHSKGGGHSSRIKRAAYRKAARSLAALGFTEAQVQQALKDAQDMVELELNAE